MLYDVFRYSEMGTVVIGKVESGRCNKGDTLLVMPNRVSITPSRFNFSYNYSPHFTVSKHNIQHIVIMTLKIDEQKFDDTIAWTI